VSDVYAETARLARSNSGRMGNWCTCSDQRIDVEGRIAFLKTELKITDAQMPVWNAVADAIRAAPKDVSGMPCIPMMQSSGTLPERLAAREKAMTAHLEALRKLRSAVEPLYVALSDDQKKTADQLMIGPMGMGTM